MNTVLSILFALGLSQAGEPAAATTAAEPAPATTTAELNAARAAEAAERAATAAQSAAEAASRAASAAERVAAAAPVPAAAQAPAGEAPAAPKQQETAWTGTVSVGFISLTGNARSITTTGAASATRQSEHWIFSAKANGAYGQSRPPAASIPPEVVALNALLELRGDRRLTDHYSVYLLAGALTDHVKSVEAFPYGEAGLSILWLEQREGDFIGLRLQTDLAFRYGKEYRFQYYPTPLDIPDLTLAAPKLGVAFRYALDRNVIFTEDFEILTSVTGNSQVLVNSTTKLSARVVSALSVGVAFIVRHDSLPAAGKLPTDTALNVGVELGF